MKMNLKVGLGRGLKETEEGEAELQANIEEEEEVQITQVRMKGIGRIIKLETIIEAEADLNQEANIIIIEGQLTKVEEEDKKEDQGDLTLMRH
jgi:hypothetical protein